MIFFMTQIFKKKKGSKFNKSQLKRYNIVLLEQKQASLDLDIDSWANKKKNTVLLFDCLILTN